MYIDLNLNIHYSLPEQVWDRIDKVYKSMPYWAGNDAEVKWIGDDIDLCAFVEPSGIKIAGTMPDDIWNKWYSSLKNKLTKELGYEIGEVEEGYDFKYYE